MTIYVRISAEFEGTKFVFIVNRLRENILMLFEKPYLSPIYLFSFN